MAILFSILLLASLGILIFGLIMPEKVIIWGEEKSRKKVIKVYGILSLVFFILIGLTAPDESNSSEPKGKKEKTAVQSNRDIKKDVSQKNYYDDYFMPLPVINKENKNEILLKEVEKADNQLLIAYKTDSSTGAHFYGGWKLDDLRYYLKNSALYRIAKSYEHSEILDFCFGERKSIPSPERPAATHLE